jgi:hypothetical protein
MSVPGIYYHTGKFLVWLWCKYVKKTKIGYKDIIFKYSGWLFWTVGVIFGIFVSTCVTVIPEAGTKL